MFQSRRRLVGLCVFHRVDYDCVYREAKEKQEAKERYWKVGTSLNDSNDASHSII